MPSVALAAITKFAVSVVELVTVTLVVVMPLPLKLMLVPPTTKFVPVRVMFDTVVPCTPWVVLSELSVGGGDSR